MIRWAVRLVFLAVAAALAFGGPVPAALQRLFPALSPLVAAASSLAQRRWYLGFFWGFPPLLFLGLAFWKGRLFCRWVCPAGTVYSIPAKLSARKTILRLRLKAYIFWAIVFASVLGVPLLLFLDPLSTFNRLAAPFTGAFSWPALVPGLILPFFLLLGFFQPQIWCAHVCPLGYLFELCHRLRRPGPAATVDRERRAILTGLCVGLPFAWVGRRFFLRGRALASPVLAPGAGTPDAFAAACTRCYACVNVCPTGVLRVGSPVRQGLMQLFEPELDATYGHCLETCNECTRVCPTGALSPVTVEDKQRLQIGLAKVNRAACLSWTDGEYCMVCQEYCPYHAIDASYTEGRLARPVINANACRGCGLCQNKCPAIRAGIAIIVEGVSKQKQLAADA